SWTASWRTTITRGRTPASATCHRPLACKQRSWELHLDLLERRLLVVDPLVGERAGQAVAPPRIKVRDHRPRERELGAGAGVAWLVVHLRVVANDVVGQSHALLVVELAEQLLYRVVEEGIAVLAGAGVARVEAAEQRPRLVQVGAVVGARVRSAEVERV